MLPHRPSSFILHPSSFYFDKLSQPGAEFCYRDSACITLYTVTNCDRTGFCLSLTEHEHVWNLLQSCVANLRPDFFAAQIRAHTMPISKQLARDVFRLVVEPVRDRQNDGLQRSEPDRKSTGVMLDENPEKPLEGAEYRAMHHDRLMRPVVGADVFNPETLGQIVIDLNRRKLPEPLNRVDDLEIDLRPVECRFIFHPLVRQPALIQRIS